jgi:hypothetical protein
MKPLTAGLAGKTAETARTAFDKLETRVLVAEGRKSFRRKAQTVAKVSKKAARAAAIAGVVAAASVVVREVKKRKKL